MKAIEKALTDWIQFGRDNGNDFNSIDNTYGKDFEFEVMDNECIIRKDGEIFTEINIYEILGSKGHIEAVARGSIIVGHEYTERIKTQPERVEELIAQYIDMVISYITKDQAIAIRDGKLEEFINSIIK